MYPIHPMLVALPIGFFAGTLISDIVSVWGNSAFWPRYGHVAHRIWCSKRALVAYVPQAILFVSGWLGGRLSYHFRVGVQSESRVT